MSAWRIGTSTRRSGLPEAALPAEPTGAGAFVDKLTKWIPGDILALYVALVTVVSGTQTATAATAKGGTAVLVHATPRVWLLIVMAILTPVVIVGGAVFAKWAGGTMNAGGVVVRAILGEIAFLVWSLTVPLSGWQGWKTVAAHPKGVTAIAAIFGFLYGFAADPIVKQIEST